MSFRRVVRSRWLLAAVGPLVALLAVVVFYFEPQAALFDEEVNDPRPAAVVFSDATEFVSLEHGTSGAVSIATSADGVRFLRVEGLDTVGGPDLRLYLSANPADGPRDDFDAQYVDLGELRGNVGDLTYEIDPTVDLSRFSSVVIWCNRFDAAFGAAPLPVSVSR